MNQTQDQNVVAYLLAVCDYLDARRALGEANRRAFSPYVEIVFEPKESYTFKELRQLLRRSGIKLK